MYSTAPAINAFTTDSWLVPSFASLSCPTRSFLRLKPLRLKLPFDARPLKSVLWSTTKHTKVASFCGPRLFASPVKYLEEQTRHLTGFIYFTMFNTIH